MNLTPSLKPLESHLLLMTARTLLGGVVRSSKASIRIKSSTFRGQIIIQWKPWFLFRLTYLVLFSCFVRQNDKNKESSMWTNKFHRPCGFTRPKKPPCKPVTPSEPQSIQNISTITINWLQNRTHFVGCVTMTWTGAEQPRRAETRTKSRTHCVGVNEWNWCLTKYAAARWTHISTK